MQEKEKLQKLVNECNSFSEILRKQGKAVSGDAVKLLKQKLEVYEIPYLFISETLGNFKLKPLEEVLVENSSYKPQDLKKRLIKAGLKEELLELIKTKTFVEIGKMYGITDNSVRKWCKKYGLPSTKKELKDLFI